MSVCGMRPRHFGSDHPWRTGDKRGRSVSGGMTPDNVRWRRAYQMKLGEVLGKPSVVRAFLEWETIGGG